MDNLRYIYNYDPRFIPATLEEEQELEYSGDYAKYPTKRQTSGYYSLVDRREEQYG
jgi:hypothetical protein